MAEGYPTEYRILAQSNDVTVTLEGTATSLEEAKELGEKNVKGDSYNRFIVVPIATQHAYNHGHISFCPRCGTNIAEDMGDDGESFNNDSYFTCDNCEAEVNVSIEVPESDEDEE